MVGRPRLYESAEEMDKVINDYFNQPVMIDTSSKMGISSMPSGQTTPNPKPTITGLTLHLGFADKTTLYDYRDRPEFSHSVKSALTRIEMYHEEGLSEGNVAGRIFALKNMGWKDKHETEHSGEMSIKTITGMQIL